MIMLLARKSRYLQWAAIASVIVLIAGSITPADARGRGGGGHFGGRSGSVQGRFGASSAGRSRQAGSYGSRSNHRYSSGGFSSAGQFGGSRGSYQGSRQSYSGQTSRRSSQTTRQSGSASRNDRATGRQGDRSDRQTNRSDNRGDRSDNRSENRGDRQDQRTDRQDNRQDGRSDRTEQRQDGRSDRVDSRADNFDDYWGGYYGHFWGANDAWWALAAGLVIGATIATLPPVYETVYVGSTTYYYANGHYYTPAPSGGYVYTAPPTGVTVQQPPDQVINVTVNDKDYGYAEGAYYEVQEPEEEGGEPTFKTVEAPLGAKVDYLPDGVTSETIDGVAYFVFNDVYYRPFYSGSDVVYIVSENPEATGKQS
jgi:hypothetical protein